MQERPIGAPKLRPLTTHDIGCALKMALRDFRAAIVPGLLFASFFVIVGLLAAWVTALAGQTFWLVLAVMGFPLIGAFAAFGFYETSRRIEAGESVTLGALGRTVWQARGGQLPWLAVIIVIIFLFWFFLGHMIFALFLGLKTMMNISSSLDVFVTPAGLQMLSFGTVVGAIFAALIFAMTVIALPMLLDREVDFVTAMLASIGAVKRQPVMFFSWGASIAAITLIASIPMFLGLFIVLPILGHATWHIYRAICVSEEGA